MAIINFVFILFLHCSSLFISIFEPFLRVIKISEIGTRGASGLAPEPGFSGAILVCTLAIGCFRRDFFGEHNNFYKLLAITIFGVIMTRSGTGSLYLLIFLFLYYVRIKHVYSLVIFCTVFYLTLLFVDFGRGERTARDTGVALDNFTD